MFSHKSSLETTPPGGQTPRGRRSQYCSITIRFRIVIRRLLFFLAEGLPKEDLGQRR